MSLRIAFLFVCAVGAVAFACADSVDYYVFSARHFDTEDGCLDPYKPLETVRGPGANGNCPKRCLSVGHETYVTAMCGTVPTIATVLDPSEPECAAALAVDASCAGVVTTSDAGDNEPEDADTGTAADAGPADANEAG